MQQRTAIDHDHLLSTYLDDHRAGAAAGVSLAHRMLEANSDNYLATTMRELSEEIERDRQALDDVMQRLGFTPNRLKMAMGTVAEWVARLKPNGHVLRYTPLSRLEDFEKLSAGIMAKASLWRCCELALSGRRPAVADVDFDALRQGAERQLAKLESHRERIVDDAFGRATA